MRITIIAPFSFGYVDALVEELRSYPPVEVCFIQLERIKFSYTGFPQRVKNFFMKTFLGKNLKTEYQDEQIKRKVLEQPPSDMTLVIRPDKLKKETLVFLKEHSGRLISYYFDAIDNIPKMESRIPFFDKIFSYEKKDVEKFGLHFITNYIPSDTYTKPKETNEVFNISSYDERFPVLEEVGKQLHRQNHPYRILVRQKKKIKSAYVQVVDSYVPLSETKRMIEEAGILLDIQKSDQRGLSFRVFEALGAGKKLITTNAAIEDYDFYTPENILVIKRDKPVIPKIFLERPYVEIPESVLGKYRRGSWIEEVFGIQKD